VLRCLLTGRVIAILVSIALGLSFAPRVIAARQLTPTLLTITGSAISGTAGVALPATLKLTLHQVRAIPVAGSTSNAAQLTEILTRETTPDAAGAFRFDNISAQIGDVCVVTTDYEGITQGSSPIALTNGQRTLDLPITLYAATHDASALHILKTQQLLTFSSTKLMQVLETVDWVNAGDRYYLSGQTTPDGTPISVSLPLPIGARGIAFNTAPITRFAIGGSINAPVIQDSKAVLPGQVQEIIFSYQLPYDKGAPIDRDYPYATDAIQMLVPGDAGIAISAPPNVPPFVVTENTNVDKQHPYTQYAINAPLKAGERFIYTLNGAPLVFNNAPPKNDSTLWIAIVLALIGLSVVIGAAAFLISRRSTVGSRQ